MNAPTSNSFARATRRAALALCVATLVAASACASAAPPPPSDAGAGPTGVAPSPSASPSPSRTVSLSAPSPPTFADPFDGFAYVAAYSDCRLLGLEKASEAFGGDPQDPNGVARAYAAAMFPSSEEHRAATVRGCLDAFGVSPSP
jgi:hypothetical protein